MPEKLRNKVGMPSIGKMLLKRGDFIEDKFGQIQRDLLAAAGKEGNNDLAVELFRWYGSYLCWWNPPEGFIMLI